MTPLDSARSEKLSAMARMLRSRFPCLTITPRGARVDPDVYCR